MKLYQTTGIIAVAALLASCEPHVNPVNVPNPVSENTPTVEAKTVEKEQVKSEEITIGFGAFKTTDKVRVGGEFKEFAITNVNTDVDGVEKYENAEIAIDVSSLSTGNPDRDAKLQEFFFGMTSSTESIEGKVKALNVEEGTSIIEITFNGVTAELPFTITNEEGKTTFNGVLELSSFDATKALESINEACKALHTGADGVSKTWDDVDLVIEIK